MMAERNFLLDPVLTVCFYFSANLLPQDLKKQTALRLAQEQQGLEQGVAVPEKPKAYRVVDPVRSHPQHVHRAGLVPSQVEHEREHLPYGNVNHSESSAGVREQNLHGTFENYSADPPMNMNMNYADPPMNMNINHNLPYHQQQEPYRRHGMESMPTQTQKLPVVGSHSGYHNHQPEQVLVSDYRKSSSNMSLSSFDSNSQKQANGKPKLPHGLTVHELKEMTKARLHAEAAEKNDGDAKPNESHRPVPSTVNVGPEHRDPHQMTRSQASPIPPGFHGHRMLAVSPYPDNLDHQNRFGLEGGWSPEPRGGDAWETASVSTAASDYLPPDSAFSSGGGHDDYTFARSRTYPAAGGSNFAPHEIMQVSTLPGPGSSPSLSYYDGYTPNRRRAATLSPRLGLMHLHEDRPVLSGEGGPGIPSFSSSSRRSHLPARARGAYNADTFNYNARQRTSSTTSLPATSNTAEEFAGTEANPSLFMQFESVTEYEYDDSELSVTGLVDVFRGSPSPASFNGMNTGPPGLVDSDRHISSSSSNGFGSFGGGDERARASTWSGHASDLFGPGLFDSRSDDQDGLAGELALILKLAGAEEKPDTVGSFYPPPGL
jgi:hypothetical protein